MAVWSGDTVGRWNNLADQVASGTRGATYRRARAIGGAPWPRKFYHRPHVIPLDKLPAFLKAPQ